MNTQDADFLRSETKRPGNTQREPGCMSEREGEFQSALENYLADYRLAMEAYRCRAENAPSSALHRFVEWFRRKVSVAEGDTYSHFKSRLQARIDGH